MNFEDIKELQEKFPLEAEQLSQLWRDSQEAEMMAGLEEIPGIKRLLALYDGYVEAINSKLLADAPLEKEERNTLIAERKAFKLLREHITTAKLTKESTNNLLNYVANRGNKNQA